MSNAGKRHMGRVAALPCAICGATPVQVHHMRQTFGASERAPDTLTIPLCLDHHLGNEGIHLLGEKGFRMRYKRDEIALLAETLEKLA